MIINTKELLNDYFNWYESKYTINELSSNASEIVTPFVNHLNDRIAIYVEILDDDKIRISDDGVTLQELEMMGYQHTDSRKKLFDEIKKNFGINQFDDVLCVVANSISEFPQKKHNLIQAILKTYDLLLLSTRNVKSMFIDDVYNYFYKHEFGGKIKDSLEGHSGIKHEIDYSLGATDKRPKTLIQIFDEVNFQKVAAQGYIYEDLKKIKRKSNSNIEYIIIANDKRKISDKATTAADDIGIKLFLWSDKQRILSLK